jgi:hypothetical protein
MRSSAIAPALAVALTLLAGCAGGEAGGRGPAPQPERGALGAPDASPPTAAERAWVDELGGWMLGVQNATFHANDDYLRGCATSLAGDVAPPPTPRLSPLRRKAAHACREIERALAVAHDRRPQAELHLRRARRTLDDVVETILVASQPTVYRPLPVRGGTGVRTSRIEPRVSRLATRFAKRPVEARCWSDTDWRSIERELAVYTGFAERISGYAPIGEGTINLAAAACDPLVRVLYGGRWPTAFRDSVELAAGVGLLAHEVRHVVGASHEARVECWAMQHVDEVAELLGATARGSRRLAETYSDAVYLRDHITYGSPECRDGGRLDLRPGSSEWP